MNDFKNAYRSAIQGIEEFHIDVSVCMDERRHKQRVVKHARRTVTTAFSAMCVIFVCGFGSVKGAEYFQNVIRVNERGFESGDSITMARNEVNRNSSYILEEQINTEEKEESESSSLLAAEESRADKEAATASMKTNDEQELAADSGAAVENMKQKQPAVYNYSSWEEFEQNEDIIFPQPSISMGKNIKSTEVTVCGNWAEVRYEVDDKVFLMERADYTDTEGHEASKVFPGGVSNERTYTTPEKYTYMLVDSATEADSDKLQIHAAVTVGSYEVFIDFLGFTEKEAKEIMNSIDLSLYE